MAFDKNLLPKGAITLQEFMKKHDPKEIENRKVSYLLPDGKPLNYVGNLLEGIEVEVFGGDHRFLVSRLPNSGANVLASEELGWGVTEGWGDRVTKDVASDSVIAVLDYNTKQSAPEHGAVGKSAEEWLELPGFDPSWFEGARFEGYIGHLVRDLSYSPDRPAGWNFVKRHTGAEGDWLSKVRYPWIGDTLLYLTAENEAKALANSKPERVGKTVGEWLATRDFDPEWFEGACFEGSEGHLTRDPNYPHAHLASGWNSDRGANSNNAWNDDIYIPWVRGATLHLTPENEAKVLTAETLATYRVTAGHHEGWYDLTRLMADDLPVDFEALRGTDFRLRFKNASQLWVQGRFTGSADSTCFPASSHWHWRIADDLRTVMRKAWNGQEGARILVRDVNLLNDKGDTSRTIDARDLPDDSVVEVVNQENGDVRTAHISTGKLRGNNGAILGKSFVITRVLYRHKQAGRNGEN